MKRGSGEFFIGSLDNILSEHSHDTLFMHNSIPVWTIMWFKLLVSKSLYYLLQLQLSIFAFWSSSFTLPWGISHDEVQRTLYVHNAQYFLKWALHAVKRELSIQQAICCLSIRWVNILYAWAAIFCEQIVKNPKHMTAITCTLMLLLIACTKFSDFSDQSHYR